MKKSDELWKVMKNIFPDDKSYGKYMVEIKDEKRLPTGFFPGGRTGLLGKNKSDTFKFMVLGNDWGTDDDLNKKNKDEEGNTYKGLERLFNKTDIKNKFDDFLNETFFTNCYMGVRKGGKKIGQIKRDKDYKLNCERFFQKQLSIIKPVKILVLGNAASNFLNGFKVDNETESFLIPHTSYWYNVSKKLESNDFKEEFMKFITK